MTAGGILEALSKTDNSQINIKEDWDLQEVLKFEPTLERKMMCFDGQKREFTLGGEVYRHGSKTERASAVFGR